MSNIVNTSITFLNHSSVLLEHKSTVIFTDPFYDKPAFETWAPSPPCATNPAYLLAMSKSGNNFAIMVSHGHDDHCDDRLLKLFNHCTIIITKFSSPGLRNRITSLGYTKIIEIDEEAYPRTYKMVSEANKLPVGKIVKEKLRLKEVKVNAVS